MRVGDGVVCVCVCGGGGSIGISKKTIIFKDSSGGGGGVHFSGGPIAHSYRCSIGCGTGGPDPLSPSESAHGDILCLCFELSHSNN